MTMFIRKVRFCSLARFDSGATILSIGNLVPLANTRQEVEKE